ncbi:hypothetical protein GCM10012319_38840 [Comamonas sp. KCTC 72670]|nr:hypothetical protein GCM10012319_38840 [Comamonas sp. KCTC 72670]
MEGTSSELQDEKDGIRQSTQQVDRRRGGGRSRAPDEEARKERADASGSQREAAVDRAGGEAVEAPPLRKKAAEATGRR